MPSAPDASPGARSEPRRRPPGIRLRRIFESPLVSKEATHGIYIEIVVLALIVALERKGVADSTIVGTLLGALVALVLAELYTYYVGTMIATGQRPTRRELRATLVGTGASLAATVPPVLLLMLGVVGLIRLEVGFTAAKWTGVTVLGLYALLATLRAGFSLRLGLMTAVGFTFLGVGLVFLKQLFH